MDKLKLRVPPLIILVVCAALMLTLSLWLPLKVEFLYQGTFGALLMGLGGTCAFLGAFAFWRHKTTMNPLKPEQSSSLVVSGIYRVSRNPMYLGFFFGLCGFAVYLGDVFACCVLPLFICYLNRFQITPEEELLRQHFGDEYLAYCRKVNRWL